MTSTQPMAVLGPKDLFDVRQKVVQQTNPLRAKILLFSSLYHPFCFSSQDWMNLKVQELDELMRQVLSTCRTANELHTKLNTTAQAFTEIEEYIGTANVLFKYMKFVYGDQPQTSTPSYPDSSDDSSLDSEQTQFDEQFDDTDDDAQTIDFENHPELWSNLNQPIVSQIQLDLPSEDLSQTLNLETPDPVHSAFSSHSNGEILLNLPNSEDSEDSVDSIESSIQPLLFSDSDPSGFTEDTTHTSLDSQPGIIDNRVTFSPIALPDPPAGSSNFSITESLMEMMGLEEEIEALTSEKAKMLRIHLTSLVQQIEQELDRKLVGYPQQECRSIKHQALYKFTELTQTNLSKLQILLDKQAKSASLEDAVPTPYTDLPYTETSYTETPYIEPSYPEPQSTPPPPPAPQIDVPRAIVALIDRSLKSRGIHTLATLKETCLHIILESEHSLNPLKIVAFIQKSLAHLEFSGIEMVKVHGRKPGQKSPDWTQLIHI
jgi:hypothetical protein